MYCNNSNDYNKNSIPKTQKAKIAALTPSDDEDFMITTKDDSIEFL